MHKSILLLSGLFLISALSFSQGAGPGAGISPQGPPPVPIFIEDITGRPFSEKNLSEIQGSPFLLPDWQWGAVKFKNGKFAKDLQLRYNVFKNVLYFQRNEAMLEFVQPVQEFILGYIKEGDSVALVFRNGYPGIEKNNGDTYYEVLADGTMQLLKQYQKNLLTYKPYNQAEKQEFSDKERLFLLRNGSMQPIKKDKESILSALPTHAEKIRQWCEQHKSKLKTEKEIAGLIAFLNQPSS